VKNVTKIFKKRKNVFTSMTCPAHFGHFQRPYGQYQYQYQYPLRCDAAICHITMYACCYHCINRAHYRHQERDVDKTENMSRKKLTDGHGISSAVDRLAGQTAQRSVEKLRPWCGQPSDRGRLKNRTEPGPCEHSGKITGGA